MARENSMRGAIEALLCEPKRRGFRHRLDDLMADDEVVETISEWAEAESSEEIRKALANSLSGLARDHESRVARVERGVYWVPPSREDVEPRSFDDEMLFERSSTQGLGFQRVADLPSDNGSQVVLLQDANGGLWRAARTRLET